MKTWFLGLLLISSQANAIVKIAVIDTGFNYSTAKTVSLCKKGHLDLTNTTLRDNHGHGTNIAAIVAANAKTNYCLVIIKYIEPVITRDQRRTAIQAFEHAVNLKVDIINYSSSGGDYFEEEYRILKKATSLGIKVFIAAGNNNIELNDKKCNIYPACYKIPKLNVVGNGRNSFDRNPMSNYGSKITQWENGQKVVGGGWVSSGTSQATAIASGKAAAKIRTTAGNEMEAVAKATEAAYKQSGLETMINDNVVNKLPDNVKELGKVLPIVQMIKEQKIVFKQEF